MASSDSEENVEIAGPSKKKYLTAYSESWEKIPEFANWLGKVDEFTANCRDCQVNISVKYEGRRALNVHKNSTKHKKMETARKMSGSIKSFFVKKESSEEMLITKAELASVFHNVKHGLSYNSMDCLLKIAPNIYCDSRIASKISCGRTKAAAITRNILGPYSQQQLVTDLKEAYYFSVSSDASNVGHMKTYPYVVQYLHPEKGMCTKLLDFYEDPKESSKDIFECIKKITETHGLKMDQIAAYSADNANVNYGKHNSVFQKIQDINKHVVKANCNCHVINNCVKFSIKAFDCDIENIVIKIYNEFSSSASRTEKLKQCFAFAQMEYKELLRHVPTRWLSLLPAIDRLLYSWPAVKHYFLIKGKDNCQKVLWDFISYGINDNYVIDDDDNNTEECKIEGLSECYLYFLHNVLSEFQSAILKLEDTSCTIVEVDPIMRTLLASLENRSKDKFYGSKAHSLVKNLSEQERSLFFSEVDLFLKRSIQYLRENYNFNDNFLFKKLSKFSLKSNSLFEWSELSELPKILNIEHAVDMDTLYTDYCCFRESFKNLPKELPNDKIWIHFFKHDQNNDFNNLKKIASFIFAIPISNAQCERVFSLLNDLFTKERNRMTMDLIKAELQIRINFDSKCSDFVSYLDKPEATELIKSAKSNSKYKWN